MGKIELLCLGTGDAETALYGNVSCTSFALLLDGFPVVLIGVGPGVIRAVAHYAHLVPECILLLNASLEQCNELSALIAHETAMRRRVRVFASQDVCQSISELLALQLRDQPMLSQVAEYVTLVSLPVVSAGPFGGGGAAMHAAGSRSVSATTAAGEPHHHHNHQPTSGVSGLTEATVTSADFFSLVQDFSILLHGPVSSATLSSSSSSPAVPPSSTCSAVMCYRDQPILALSGPIPFDASRYAKMCQAPFVVVWAAQQPSDRRASIFDIAAFSDKVNVLRRPEERVVFLVAGYGSASDTPLISGYVVLLQQGSPIVLLASESVQSPFTALHLPLPHVRKTNPMKYPLNGKTTVLANDAAPPQPSSSGLLHHSTGTVPRVAGGASTVGSGGGGLQPGMTLTAANLMRTGWDRPAGGGGGGGVGHVAAAGGVAMGAADGGSDGNSSDGGHRPSSPLRHQRITSGWMDSAAASFGNGGGASGASGGAGTGQYDTRKVYVFTNEDKGAPGKLLLLKNFRTLSQLEQKVAQVFSLKPIRSLHVAAHGAAVRGLDELADGVELVAVRRGGAPFNPQDLPRLLRGHHGNASRH